MEKGYLNEVKAILKSLVLSCPDKITIEALNRDFRDVEGQDIPYRKLGYGNLEQFLRSITDTLRVYGSGPTAMVCFVANEKSDHIHDMIMEQKKPSRRVRRRSKPRNPLKNSSSGRSSNRFSNNSQPRKMPGQQFSAFQSTNRNHMTKTLKVRDVPPPLSSASKYANHRPPCFQYTGYELPQPSGIKLTSTQPASNNTVPNAVTKIETRPTIEQKNGKDNVISKEQLQKYEEHVKQLSSLMTSSCHITHTKPAFEMKAQTQLKTVTPASSAFQPQSRIKAVTPASSASEAQLQLKTVSFSLETKTKYEIKSPSQPELQTSNTLNGIKPPKPKIKLSKDIERLLNVPSRGSTNPIQESCDPNKPDDDIINAKTYDIQNIRKKSNIVRNIFDVSDIKEVDADEAVPEFAANNLVYRLDFPDHTVGFGRKIPPYILADDVYVGSYLRIFISEIHNPFKFWFHIQRDEHELDLLMYQIERYYTPLCADELSIPIPCLTPGQTCAALYNDLWHRAEIVAPPVNNKIKVSFMDYGTVCEVDIKNVKFLASSFALLPAQALRGCLSHIKPRFLHWSHEATTYFLSLVSELMLYAKITEIDRKNQVIYMILCNTHGEEVIQINKSLVNENYASYNEDWLEEKIIQNKGQRIHHPREEFPTFSMIESGEYPSFAELVNLERRGIDYETIYDRIIFNKSAILNKHENAPEAIRNLPYYLTTSNPFRYDIIMALNGMTAGVK